jgi:hypothetical protein
MDQHSSKWKKKKTHKSINYYWIKEQNYVTSTFQGWKQIVQWFILRMSQVPVVHTCNPGHLGGRG